ncbi:MAG TPA: SIR2 family protein [Thermoanaerobaculia bacterium]
MKTIKLKLPTITNANVFQGIVPAELLEALRANRCVLFVGAGLSAQVQRADGSSLPNWSQFLTELLDWALAREVLFWGDPEDIRNMIKSGDLLMAAQELQERVTIASISDFMHHVFRDAAVRPAAVHHLLPQIPFRAVLTTNYDTLLEGAYSVSSSGRIPPVLTQHDLTARPSLLRRSDFFIFKVHGHLDRPESVVLGSRDYQDILFQTPGYRQFLETLFATHTVLFIGFGGQDPDLDNVLDRLAALYSRTLDRHFILLPSGRMNATQKRRLALDRRLEVIEYFVDPTHSQIVAFLEEIKRQLAGGATSVALTAKQSTAPAVFVSASMKDSEIVRRLTGFLRERGFVPWAAADEIQAGDDLRQRISEALAAADCVIVLFSAHSAESAWVRYEAEAAMVREVTGQTAVLPVVVGDFGDADLPAYFRNRSYLRLPHQFTSDDLQPLLAALTRITRERSRPGESDRSRF